MKVKVTMSKKEFHEKLCMVMGIYPSIVTEFYYWDTLSPGSEVEFTIDDAAPAEMPKPAPLPERKPSLDPNDDIAF